MEEHRIEIIGQVENVSYDSLDLWACQVAMNKGDVSTGKWQYFFHRSMRLSVCEFAERCKQQNSRVRLLATENDGTSIVHRIEFADSNATSIYKYPEPVIENIEKPINHMYLR